MENIVAILLVAFIVTWVTSVVSCVSKLDTAMESVEQDGLKSIFSEVWNGKDVDDGS